MPRLNIPQRTVRSAGSTGVQPDINTDSPQFAALSRLAGDITGFADQKFEAGVRVQQHVDSGAIAGMTGRNKNFLVSLDGQLAQADGHKSQREVATSQFNEYRQSVINDLNERGVSGKAKQQALDNVDALQETFNVNLARKQLGESINEANADYQSAAQDMFESGDIEGGVSTIERTQGLTPLERSELEKVAIENAQKNVIEAAISQAKMNPSKGSTESISESIQSNPVLTDKQKEAVLFDIENEYQSSVSKTLSIGIEQLQVNNDVASIEAAQAEAESRSGSYGELSGDRLAAKKNELEAARQTVFNRQARTFDSFMTSLSKTGTYSEDAYKEAVRNGSLTAKAQAAMREIAPSAVARTSAVDKFKEDESNASYKTIRKEIDEKWIEKFAGGSNTVMTQDNFEDLSKQITENPDLGIVAKNTLLSRLMIASSQAVLEDDDKLWDGAYNALEGLDDNQRKIVSTFQREAARYVKESLRGDFLLVNDNQEAASVPITDIFIDDLQSLSEAIKSGTNVQQQIDARLSFYKIGAQRASVRRALQDTTE